MGVGRYLVACEGDEQQRGLAQPGGDAREQEQRRLVRPVEIVEHDRDGTVRAPSRRRRAAAPRSASPRRHRAPASPSSGSSGARYGASGPHASAMSGAWRRHWRRTWATGSYGSATDERAAPAKAGRPACASASVDEARLADARLARHEHASAGAVAHGGAGRLERGELLASADQRPAVEHSSECRPREAAEKAPADGGTAGMGAQVRHSCA